MQGLWCFCIYFMGINKVRLLRLFEMRLLLLILSKCLHVIAVGFLPISTAIFAKNSFICNYLYLDRFKEIISDVTYQCFPNDRLVVHEDIIMQNKMNCKLQVRRACYSDTIIDNHHFDAKVEILYSMQYQHADACCEISPYFSF